VLMNFGLAIQCHKNAAMTMRMRADTQHASTYVVTTNAVRTLVITGAYFMKFKLMLASGQVRTSYFEV
jgi:hypothetical protein